MIFVAMSSQGSTRLIASLLRASKDVRPVFLLGAGASFASGVPMAGPCVKRIAKRVYAEQVHGGRVLPEQVKLTEWMTWLQGQRWFIPGDESVADNFPLVVEHLLTPREYRRQVLMDVIRPTSGVSSGYAQRALVEITINMMVHRDYTIKEPALINLEPGKSITFENPGTLLEEVASKVQLDRDGAFTPKGPMSGLRNASLCDVFFGMSAMERAGTGLVDAEVLMREDGGSAHFRNDMSGGRFVVRLEQPRASAGSRSIARDDRPAGTYVINALPFSVIPDSISQLKLTAPLGARPQGMPLGDAGVFVCHGTELWTFVPMEKIADILKPILVSGECRSVPLAEAAKQEDSRRLIPWLLRRHFERHVRSFEADGLILEDEGRGRRAYFAGQEGGPRTLTYKTPKKQRVLRQVVKRREVGSTVFFENEGFGYEVIRFDETWAIRLKPFYMFTGNGAMKPLPSYLRAARATRRIKFDRNKSVDDDLTFWSRFVSRGAATFNIGFEHVQDLVVEGSFFSIEVVEKDTEQMRSNESPDRMPA